MGAAFTPEEAPIDSSPPFEDLSGDSWTPLYHHACVFGPEVFDSKMMNLVKNPNINSSWLFRADIVYDGEQGGSESNSHEGVTPVVRDFRGFTRQRTLVRRLIPRNERRDAPLDQTCTFHQSSPTDSALSSLVIYTPHVSSASDLPFYHPKVKSIAHLHEWDSTTSTGRVSIHYIPYPEHPIREDPKLQRTAFHLLQVIHKHGSSASGYVKRVHHDQVIPQQRFQNRFAQLKSKYARTLVESWAESTDPNKHVFEDLGIAAFLIELWADMYTDTPFPGFVDIGCGNGLLVYLLVQEGFSGWGFDARERKSWAQYNSEASASPSGSSLEQRLLLPSIAAPDPDAEEIDSGAIHDGVFPRGTFIVSNHADELTPWTPILATLSDCPFIMIPCCSHSLAGDKYRAPPPRDSSKSHSTYSSLVDWASRIAEDCGWVVETEMLRIPSSRNTCLLGRTRTTPTAEVDVDEIVRKHGGVGNYHANVAKLVKSAPKSH